MAANMEINSIVAAVEENKQDAIEQAVVEEHTETEAIEEESESNEEESEKEQEEESEKEQEVIEGPKPHKATISFMNKELRLAQEGKKELTLERLRHIRQQMTIYIASAAPRYRKDIKKHIDNAEKVLSATLAKHTKALTEIGGNVKDVKKKVSDIHEGMKNLPMAVVKAMYPKLPEDATPQQRIDLHNEAKQSHVAALAKAMAEAKAMPKAKGKAKAEPKGKGKAMGKAKTNY